MNSFQKSLISLFLLALLSSPVFAQTTDTFYYSLQETEQQFLDKNIALIANHFNIDANKALEEQAKLWDNPNINTDQNIFSNKHWFEHGIDNITGNPKGQIYVQIQQLIKTANKRGKLVDMARTNTAISTLQFYDLLRNLKYQLRTDYFQLFQLVATKKLFDTQLDQIAVLLSGMEAQLKAGNIACKDYLRIQALQISLQQDAVDNLKKLNDVESDLRILMSLKPNQIVLPKKTTYTDEKLPYDLTQLIAIAHDNNPTFKIQQATLKLQQQNYSYQKALAVPDLTISPNYDRNSNYAPNYVGVGFSIPIPLLNRNQGNIKQAVFQIKNQEANLQYAELSLDNNISAVYYKLLATQELMKDKQEDFFSDYNKLYENILDSYKQRQISLIEFIDYFQAYKDIRQKQLQLEINLRQSKEDLNFQVGKNILTNN